MCAFSFSDPSVHSCICLIGVYSGDRCQFKSRGFFYGFFNFSVGEDKSQSEKVDQTQERQKIVEQERERDEARRKEEDARLNDQRRKDYERKIQEEVRYL